MNETREYGYRAFEKRKLQSDQTDQQILDYLEIDRTREKLQTFKYRTEEILELIRINPTLRPQPQRLKAYRCVVITEFVLFGLEK